MGKLFVTVFAPPGRGFVATLLNFSSYTQDKFEMVLTPGHPDASSGRSGQARICLQLYPYTLTVSWLRDSLYRDTAPVPAINIVTGDKFAAMIKLVPLTMLRMSGLSARHPDARFTRSGLKARNAY